MENKMDTLEDLVRIIRILRGENGCPWDRVQTHASIRMDMLEEAYEAADAIDKKDMKNLCEELGDVLMQVPEPPNSLSECIPEAVFCLHRIR